MIPYSLHPPTNEDIFEDLCLALLKQHWSKPRLERFGKRGEEQHGIDILDVGGGLPLYAAQCKLKGALKTLPPAEIKAEVEKVKSFRPKVNYFAILTTGKASTASQRTIQEINRQHKQDGLFEVDLFTWNRIEELIRRYPDVEQQFFGGIPYQTANRIERKVDQLYPQIETLGARIGRGAIDVEIDEARDYVNTRESLLAVLLLNRIERTRGDELSERQRFRSCLPEPG